MNSRLDTLQAAILLAKFELLAEELELREMAALSYRTSFMKHGVPEGVVIPVVAPHNRSAWAQYTIRVPRRPEFEQRMKAAGIPTAVHYPLPLHRQPAVVDPATTLPVSERLASEVISLPMHPYLDADQVEAIVRAALA
jgi:UDP-2-acetamido-2-deoxy-ribo-hexuluronate aminotransferase